MGAVTVGLDLGQRRDYTAVAVAEREQRQIAGRAETHHLIRHLQRLPLGAAYPTVARRVAEICAAIHTRTGQHPRLYVDATGVGIPVVDLLRAEGVQEIRPVFFTHGDRRMVEGREVKLGKAWLVSRLQALLQTGRVHLPNVPEAVMLARELLDYEIKIDQNANDTYGAFRVGSHDDLVTALGLATQEDEAGGLAFASIPRFGARPPMPW